MTPPPPRPLVVVVGAGPAGCLAALLLSAQGATVRVYDRRGDIRDTASANGPAKPDARQRSINLALSARGIAALHRVGLDEKLRAIAAPMFGRVVHARADAAGCVARPAFQPYGQPHEHLLSVSRAALTALLLDACDADPHVDLCFAAKCVAVDLHAPSVTVQRAAPDAAAAGDGAGADPVTETVHATLIVGADGAFSRVRAAMAREPHFDYSQSYVPTLYKELTMDVTAVRRTGDGDGSDDESEADARARFRADGLHIWPRGAHMLIALPNDAAGDSFTSTLFLPRSLLATLDSAEAVRTFFAREFADAVSVLPDLERDFFENPSPPLVTVRCGPYNFDDKAVVLGDAAHAIVPFYGQGCNAALEDCGLLADAMATHGWTALGQALSTYATGRKRDADTIADLALEHYHDMSARSASPVAVLRRRLEILANRLLPRAFLPLYSMVSFSTRPYAAAVARARAQEQAVAAAGLAVATAAAAVTVAVVRRVDFAKLDVRGALRSALGRA